MTKKTNTFLTLGLLLSFEIIGLFYSLYKGGYSWVSLPLILFVFIGLMLVTLRIPALKRAVKYDEKSLNYHGPQIVRSLTDREKTILNEAYLKTLSYKKNLSSRVIGAVFSFLFITLVFILYVLEKISSNDAFLLIIGAGVVFAYLSFSSVFATESQKFKKDLEEGVYKVTGPFYFDRKGVIVVRGVEFIVREKDLSNLEEGAIISVEYSPNTLNVWDTHKEINP